MDITGQSENPSTDRVSVVIPAHNSATTIARALDSVFAQGGCVGQVIVVDDGSIDGTADVVSAAYSDVQLIRQPQGGAAAARNAGVQAARHGYIAFIDADDWWDPQKLATQVEVLDRHPEVGLVFTDFVNIDDHGGRRRGFVQHERVYETGGQDSDTVMLLAANVFEVLCADLFVATSTVLLRKECMHQVGLFEPYIAAEDLDYWLRCARVTRFAAINRVLVNKYNRADSLGSDSPQTLRETASVLQDFPHRFPDLTASQQRALRRRLGEVLLGQGFNARKSGDRMQALKLQLRSFACRPSLLSILELGKILAWR